MTPLFPNLLRASLLAAVLCAPAPGAGVDFRTDVMAVLSKAGCNAGTCHGNAVGKGAFKLSLRGQDPDLDWQALAREQGGRRVNMVEPEQSLALLKATGIVAHEGGKRFDVASPEYDIFLRWIRDGAPDSGAALRLTKLDVTPRAEVLVEPADTAQLKAVATFSDGTKRDVTRLTVFEPNNLGVKVSVDGTVTREQFGETNVLVRFLHQQVPVSLAFAPARPEFTWSNPPAANFIDEHVFKKLRTLRMNPAGLCDDATFLRRAYLDLLGIVPTPEAVRAFSPTRLAAPNRHKRAKLVDSLMQRGDFATFWALKWADLLKIEERQLDSQGMAVFHGWIRDAIAANKPLDQFARELVAARGSTYTNPPANWWRANRDPVTRAENTARVFLGTQLNCAQCHNHPFERWTQDDYYDWTSLFSRVDYKIVENKKRDKSDTREFKGEQIVLMKAGTPGVPNPRTGQRAQAAIPRRRNAEDRTGARRTPGARGLDFAFADVRADAGEPHLGAAHGTRHRGPGGRFPRQQSADASRAARCAHEGFRRARLRPAARHPHHHGLAHLPARERRRRPWTTRRIIPTRSSDGSARSRSSTP